jgi:2-O-(6-phospho-alpha-D-mannosyl)-D-glycerate hydrolase
MNNERRTTNDERRTPNDERRTTNHEPERRTKNAEPRTTMTPTLSIHLVSHTHWDREWYLTHEQFRFRLVALIDRLLDLLEADPDYRHFHLDGQTIVLEDYLEIRPEQEARLRRAIGTGRILIGPWYVMPDEFLVSGESLVRNLLRGHRISRDFGTPMPVGYLPDLFGHVGQMPQIWRQFGLDNTILWRGFGGPDAEYWWDAPDGSRLLMMHLPPEGYCNATRVVFDPDAMMARAKEKVDFEKARTRTGHVLLMNGVDHVEPHTAIPGLIGRLSAVPGQHATHSTLPQYVAAVRDFVESAGTSLETITGELRGGTDYANLLPGVLSARVYLKQQNAHVQTLLESYAEPLSMMASLASDVAPQAAVDPRDLRRGAPARVARDHAGLANAFRYPAGELRHAWKTLLQNHPHDSICGCSIDAVHDENMTRFARARQVGEAVVESALDAIADTVPPPSTPGLIRAVVVNTDTVERAQVVEAFIDLPMDSAEPWRLVDAQALDRPVTFWPRESTITAVTGPDGQRVEFQILGEEPLVTHVMSRYETPWALNIRRLHLLWWAPALPPCGYAAFDLAVGGADTSAAPGRRLVNGGERFAENERLKMSIGDDGAFEVTDKASGVTYHRVAGIEDVGDVGDEYNYSPPASDRRVTGADARVTGVSRIGGGPLRAGLRVGLELPLPRSASRDRKSRTDEMVMVPVTIDATLDAGSPRVAFAVSVDNRASDHRLRLLFPTGAAAVGTARADTAFDLVTRPARVPVPDTIRNEAPVSSMPMILVVDAGDTETGATVIGKGLMEYEIVSDATTDNAEPAERAEKSIVGSAGSSASIVVREPAIAVTLIRAVGDLSRNDLVTRPSGHAGPPVATPGAQCLGIQRFELAFEPRGSAPTAGELMTSARAHNIAPRVTTARLPGGSGPLSRSFLRVDRRAGDVVLSAFKQSEDRSSVIVRLFNPGDVVASVALHIDAPIAQAFAVNFLEERQEPLAIDGNGVSLRLGPKQIQTIELVS